MTENPTVERTAAGLRRAFDRSFAVPPSDVSEAVEDFIKIRVAGDSYAIRLRDITEIAAQRNVVSVPAAAPHLLGLVGIRGAIVPVFGLASLLGYRGDPDAPAWIVLAGSDEPVALAFSDFEGYLTLPASAVHADEARDASQQNVREVASTDAGVRAVINMPLVVATIYNRIGHERPQPRNEQ